MNQGFQMGWPRGGAREAPRRSLQLLLHHLAPIVEEPRHTIERASWVAYTRRWQAASCETSRGMFVCDCARVRAREETRGNRGRQLLRRQMLSREQARFIYESGG